MNAALQRRPAGWPPGHGLTTRASVARATGAIATATVGLLSFLSAVTPDVPWRRHLLVTVEPGPAMGLGHILAALGGLVLVYLGWGIARRRRRAADIAIVLLLAVALVHVAKGLDYEEAGVSLALAAVLAGVRRACDHGSPPRRALIAATVAVGALAAAYTLNVTVLLVSDRAEGLGTALSSTASALADGAWWAGSGEPVAIAIDLLGVVALVAAAAFLRALLRPAQATDGHSSEDHRRAAAIVAEHGRDSLAPFALREEKSFFFAHGGLVAYRTLRETAVVSGDPIGPPRSARAILADFLRFAATHGWDVVVTAASEPLLSDYQALGMRAVCIGQEATVDPATFSLEGRAIRKVRQSVTRAERRGWRVEIVEGVGPESALASELEVLERAWRGEREREHGFAMSLGRLWGAPEDLTAVYALGRDPAGELRAFVRFAHCGGVLSLDVMRRSGDEPNGLNEALIARTLEWARERGVAEVSLNFAGFAHVMASHATLSGRQRVVRWALERMHGRFQLERLLVFNEKFRPEWRRRYLVYGTRTHAPLAALRVLQAEAYVRAPRTRARPLRWSPHPDVREPRTHPEAIPSQ